MEDLLIKTLEPFGYPVMRQGSFNKDDKYPDHFFTFWNNNSYDESFYDNMETKTIWNYDLNFYSIDPVSANEILAQAKKLLQKNDFIVSGKGYDVASDEPTHIGRGINVLKIEL